MICNATNGLGWRWLDWNGGERERETETEVQILGKASSNHKPPCKELLAKASGVSMESLSAIRTVTSCGGQWEDIGRYSSLIHSVQRAGVRIFLGSVRWGAPLG